LRGGRGWGFLPLQAQLAIRAGNAKNKTAAMRAVVTAAQRGAEL